MTELVIEKRVHFASDRRGARRLREGEPPAPRPTPAGRVPRISRLMALAIHLQDLIDRGEIKDRAEAARLGHVSRARMTQLLSLNSLAPDIQEQLLHLPLTASGRDPVRERHVRPIAAELDWETQRGMWGGLARCL